MFNKSLIDKHIDEILEKVEMGLKNDNLRVHKHHLSYAYNSKNIYLINLNNYSLRIGAFGDWSLYRDSFHRILHPTFRQKIRMKRLWKEINKRYMDKKNKKEREVLESILGEGK